MHSTFNFPQAVGLPEGTFVLTLNSDGSSAVIPHVIGAEIHPGEPWTAVAETLLGPKILDAWKAEAGVASESDTVHALVIPDTPGLPWPHEFAAYKEGCHIFDGREFFHREGETAISEWRNHVTRSWRIARDLDLVEIPTIPRSAWEDREIDRLRAEEYRL